MLLRGKTAIISGAASPRGIGLATARRFVAEGARVAILDIDGAAAGIAARNLDPRESRTLVLHVTWPIRLPARTPSRP